jgi:hypothetical protein
MFMNKLIVYFALLAASVASGQTPTPAESPAPKASPAIGTVIVCHLIFTVESASTKIETPVIGIVQSDVYQDGKLVIPKGAEATCVAEELAFRDRIQVDGKWHVTYPGGSDGIEFDGVVCERESDPEGRQFGIKDGSAGLRGIITGQEGFVRVPAGKEFYIFITGA